MYRIGTSYFPFKEAAIDYYRPHGYTRMEGKVQVDDTENAVNRKIEEGLIHIGKPPLKDNETLKVVNEHPGFRYYIIGKAQPKPSSIHEKIEKHWFLRSRPQSSILLGKIADQLRLKEGLTFEQVKEVFEQAIGQSIHMAEFDTVMAESEEQERLALRL